MQSRKSNAQQSSGKRTLNTALNSTDRVGPLPDLPDRIEFESKGGQDSWPQLA